MYIYLNNKIVRSSEAKISVFDHGFLYGDGIFETMRAYSGVIFKIDEHLNRLYRSASLIGLDINKDLNEIKIALYETLKANSLNNAYIRLSISRGIGPIGIDPDLCTEKTFVIITNEFKSYPNSYYLDGIKTIISRTRRNPTEALNPQIKSFNFLNNILAKIEAKKEQALEAIMLNMDNYIAEGTISNIFFVKDEVLCTPSISCGILDGITRNVVLEIAHRNSLDVIEGRFIKEDLLSASEVFLTNSSMELIPVKKVNETSFNVGKFYKLLHKEYKREIEIYIKEKKNEIVSLWK
ncbi:MAG: aminotransferase class IV [Thermodesulfovibrionales bacterium]|nr:aminotransferase class IV [Thermodesulfovibrionales bacterium]